jgi:uncharacterized protein (DUF488 family)
MNPIFSIGHSHYPLTRVLEMLAGADVTAVADIRSHPVSRWAPQFNKETLMRALEGSGLSYLFMGRELGGRPKAAALLTGGKPDYAKMARDPAFHEGIARLLEESARHRVALICAERDPIHCHRFLLVARHLVGRGVAVSHILANGEIEAHSATEQRLTGLNPQADLFG